MADHDAGSRNQQKHLYSAEVIARAKVATMERTMGAHHPGIGLRQHGVYFLVVSLVALAGFIAIITVVGAKM